jgi:hypothetical protein
MASISAGQTFRMGMKHPIRIGAANMIVKGQMVTAEYQDYSYRDNAANCRLRKWRATHNIKADVWIFAKDWTTALPGEPHYVRIPKKIEMALRLRIQKDFP